MAKINSENTLSQNEDNSPKKMDPKMKSRIKTGAFLLAFLIFFIANNTGNSAEEGPYPRYNKTNGNTLFTAPDFISKSVQGNNLRLSEYKGKVVILSFFSYRKPYAANRSKILESLKEEFGSEKLKVIGVSYDMNSSPANLISFLNENNVSYPVVQIDNEIFRYYRPIDPYGRLIDPMTLIVDQNGKIFTKYALSPVKKETYLKDLSMLIKNN